MNTSKKIRVIAALGTLSGAVWAGTFASFSDTVTSESTFSTGTLDLELADEVDDAYAFASLSTSNMKPGDVKFATLKVENAGSLAFTYTMASSETGDAALADALQVGAVAAAVTCNQTGYNTAAGLAGINEVIPSGALSAAAISSRSLAAGIPETLCVRIELPTATADALQGKSTVSTLTFTASQTAGIVTPA